MNSDDQNAGNTARKVGMLPELAMGYGGWTDPTTGEPVPQADDEPIETTTGESIGYDLLAMQYVERPPLTLDEIVAAVRTNELVTGRDMRYAIVAFDVLMSELHVDRNVEQLAVFFKATESVPRDYIGEANDPENAEAVEWYKAMRGVSGK